MKEGDGMTNKEAIELLTEVDRKANENGEDGDGFVALKIAIEALKREDHDGCDGCEHEPKDEFTFPCVICKQNFVDMYEPMPEREQNIDTVEVVRCKDCKHLYNDADTGKACEFTNMGMEPNDFCSYGERRDNERHNIDAE